jgi:ArsR family transcriptional regulator
MTAEAMPAKRSPCGPGNNPVTTVRHNHICLGEYEMPCLAARMKLLRIYDCLCDVTRLRLLNLLAEQPLCVCHLEAALKLPQARISRHLAYLRRNGLVTVAQQGPWRVYALASPAPAALRANLACLQDVRTTEPQLARDLERLTLLSTKLDCACATPEVPRRKILLLTRR